MVLWRPLGELMVEALCRGAANGLDPESIRVVCPVPLHESRLRERGFDQSELIAEVVADGIDRPLRSLLARTRPTLPQVGLPVQSRAANVRGAFQARLQEVIEDKRVLLIDDLYTTGATLAECARVLRRAGAAEVRAFTLARALPRWRRVRTTAA
jgi:ComF family protein